MCCVSCLRAHAYMREIMYTNQYILINYLWQTNVFILLEVIVPRLSSARIYGITVHHALYDYIPIFIA